MNETSLFYVAATGYRLKHKSTRLKVKNVHTIGKIG